MKQVQAEELKLVDASEMMGMGDFGQPPLRSGLPPSSIPSTKDQAVAIKKGGGHFRLSYKGDILNEL